MKPFAYFIALCMMTTAAVAAPGTGRRAMSEQFVASPRAGVYKAPVPAAMATTKQIGAPAVTTPVVVPAEPAPEPEVDRREKEKAACLGNNIGVGNTFVWASKYSNVNNYASMVEDVETPANNVCFVRVELKSDDAKINVSDVAAVYYPMGTTITCGDWADEEQIKQRILDAKKSGRTWGTIAGAVGGAGVGVGAMELFGNRAIGGKVEGQKDLERHDQAGLLRSQLLVLKQDDPAKYDEFKREMESLKNACTNSVWKGNPPKECDTYDYETILEYLKS